MKQSKRVTASKLPWSTRQMPQDILAPMNNRNDPNPLSTKPINDTIVSNDEFTDSRVLVFRHHAP